MRDTQIGGGFQCVPARVVGFACALAMMMVAFLAVPGAAAASVGGGWYVGYQRFSTPGINADLQAAGLPPLEQAVLVFGGGGNGPLPGSDGNWTPGGFGAGGQAESSDGDKRSRLAMGYGGVRVGYSRTLTERVSFGAGLGVAFGGVTLTAIRSDQTDFEQGLKEPNHKETTYNRFLLALIPDVGVSLQLGQLMHLHGSIGYFFDTGLGKWHSISGTVLNNSPSDTFSGLQVTLALSFGPGRGMVESDMAK